MSIDSNEPVADEQVVLVAFAPDVDLVDEPGSATETHSVILCKDPIPDAVTSFATAVRVLHFRATNIEDAAVGELLQRQSSLRRV